MRCSIPSIMLRLQHTILYVLSLAIGALDVVNASSSHSNVVQTTSGRVAGFTDTKTVSNVTLNKWLGIPFAADTSGPNRWRPPQPVRVLSNHTVFNASAYGPACLQGRADGGNGTAIQSEDCLSINIIAPANATNLPVYIYIYGGGFDSGSSSDPKIDGSFLAAKGIVFASFNYRLSLFGFPHAAEIQAAKETQNFGLLDTRAAVEWLHRNVRVFGGDPSKITLGGESVGAEMTNFYMSAYHQNPIVRAAVMQSGDTLQPQWQLNNQLEKVAANLSCPTGHGTLDCLRRVSGKALQTALLGTGTQFQPVIDNITIFKDFVKQTRQGKVAKIPLLIGTNKDEGTLIVEGEPTAYLNTTGPYVISNNLNFPLANATQLATYYPTPSTSFPSVYNVSAGMWRDAHMLCLASNLGKERTTALGLPVWRYRFDLVASNLNSRGTRIGSFHGSDIRFVMGTVDTIVLSPPFVAATREERGVSSLMVEAWTNFIKDPHLGPRIPGWKVYNPHDDGSSLAILGLSTTNATAGNHTEADKSCEYWNTLLPTWPQTFPACGNWTCSG